MHHKKENLCARIEYDFNICGYAEIVIQVNGVNTYNTR